MSEPRPFRITSTPARNANAPPSAPASPAGSTTITPDKACHEAPIPGAPLLPVTRPMKLAP